MSKDGFTLNQIAVDTPPRPSSTVLLLRDGAAGIEVLMQRRHEKNEQWAGAYVFPGGKVDRADGEIDMLSRLDLSAAEMHARMGDATLDERSAAVYFAAACREMFEETGLLVASLPDGTAADAALTMAASRLVLWSRWITPRIPSVATKRFDVRFFLARAPEDQIARHDNHEATESVWLAPRAALDQLRARKMLLAPPQIMSLAELARHATVEAAMHPDVVRWPRLIEPQSFEHDGARAVAYPGDPLHTNPERVMPGPTRLIFRNGYFEPFGEFDELFA